ncbi:MAG TPA: VOC family protein [Steroidobacteraceae bacterium]|nr:VOC family protein [Steroidobacteraceae bacterium]
MQLAYVMVFVDDMDAGVAFYRDALGLPLRFASPGWTEFDTGSTTLALHPSSKENPAGMMRLGFQVPDMAACRTQLGKAGIALTGEPRSEHGMLLAEFAGPGSVRNSLGAPQ